MTSTRSYREAKSIDQGIAELRKGAGTQFDPLVVQAFIASLAHVGWERPGPTGAPIDLATVTVQDHDDPTAPLQVVVP
jgi:HD-GYP domain-containing protein (c-di-GMP phosphodiesterase class II)